MPLLTIHAAIPARLLIDLLELVIEHEPDAVVLGSPAGLIAEAVERRASSEPFQRRPFDPDEVRARAAQGF